MNSLMIRFATATSTLSLIFLMAGCGTPAPNKLTGKVTLDGAPFPQATLQFYPSSSTFPAFSATTKDDGSFETLIPTDSKIPVGTYIVTAAKYDMKKGAKSSGAEGVDMTQLVMSGQATNVLPRKYHSYQSSPLRYEVKFPGATGDLAVTSK